MGTENLARLAIYGTPGCLVRKLLLVRPVGVPASLFPHELRCPVSSDRGIRLRSATSFTTRPVSVMTFTFSSLRRICPHLHSCPSPLNVLCMSLSRLELPLGCPTVLGRQRHALCVMFIMGNRSLVAMLSPLSARPMRSAPLRLVGPLGLAFGLPFNSLNAFPWTVTLTLGLPPLCCRCLILVLSLLRWVRKCVSSVLTDVSALIGLVAL